MGLGYLGRVQSVYCHADSGLVCGSARGMSRRPSSFNECLTRKVFFRIQEVLLDVTSFSDGTMSPKWPAAFEASS